MGREAKKLLKQPRETSLRCPSLKTNTYYKAVYVLGADVFTVTVNVELQQGFSGAMQRLSVSSRKMQPEQCKLIRLGRKLLPAYYVMKHLWYSSGSRYIDIYVEQEPLSYVVSYGFSRALHAWFPTLSSSLILEPTNF